MIDSGVSKRYALALFEIAKDNNLVDVLEEEVRVIQNLASSSSDLLKVLQSPSIKVEQKKELVQAAFAGANEYLVHTLLLVIDRHREEYIETIASEFIQLVNNYKGIADAKVYSVKALSADQEQAISATFAEKIGLKSLRIENIVDANLLGGIKVRIGNVIYDGSLQGKLNRIQQQLLG